MIRSIFFFIINSIRNIVLFGCLAAFLITIVEMILYRRRSNTSMASPEESNVPLIPTAERRKQIALITGASSGLGSEFARLAARESGIDEVYITARRKDKLDALAETLGVPVTVIPADLTDKDDISGIREKIAGSDSVLALFINCAGMGLIGDYNDVNSDDADRIIELNCRAAVDITQAVIPYMANGSRIIEVCSTAAFQPIPYLNVYAASKAFLYNYTRALRMELLSRNIMVTAVCPYWIKDTEFIQKAGSQNLDPAGRRYIRSFNGGCGAAVVADRAMCDSRLGLAVSTPGLFCTVHRAFAKLLPRSVMMYFWELARKL